MKRTASFLIVLLALVSSVASAQGNSGNSNGKGPDIIRIPFTRSAKLPNGANVPVSGELLVHSLIKNAGNSGTLIHFTYHFQQIPGRSAGDYRLSDGDEFQAPRQLAFPAHLIVPGRATFLSPGAPARKAIVEVAVTVAPDGTPNFTIGSIRVLP